MQLPPNLTMLAPLPASYTWLTMFHYALYNAPAFKARLSYGAFRTHPETGYRGPRSCWLKVA